MNIICPQITTDRHRFFKILSAFICVHLWFIFTVNAQNLHQWGNISLFHGLPSDKVHAITQTNDGIFWFGTENGLAKFDGRRVQTIPLEQVTQVFSLASGKDGTLFIGTNNGLFYFKDDKFFLAIETRQEQINSISANENIYFVTQSGKIFQFENNTAKPISDVNVSITSIISNGQKTFIGTQGRGLLELKNGNIEEIKSSFRPYFINDLEFANNDLLWLGSQSKTTDSGLFNFSDSNNFRQLGDQIGTINSIKFDEKNNLWLGTKNKGVYLFNNDKEISNFTFENTSGGLRSNQIFDIFTDREGVIWFGTDKGVCRFDGSSPFNYSFSEDSDGGNFVRTLFHSNDQKIYAGTNKGLYFFNNQTWVTDKNFVGKSIYTIGENVDNQIVIGTPTDNIRAIQTLNSKTYTIIFGKGFFENDKLIFAHDAFITAYADKEKIYLGTVKDGVLEFSDGKIKPLEILQDNAIRQISGTQEKGLWFATEKGLFRWQNLEIQEVIEDIDFRSILVKDDKIYAGSLNKGLFQIKLDEEFGWIFSNLNIEQGLLSSGIFSILPQENSLILATGKGISTYSTNHILPKIVVNRIISERVHTNKEINDGINLDYPQNTLNIEVTGVSSRTFPENFQYGYLLKNSKGEIVLKKLTKDSQISFENLPPDNYSAEIRTFNQDLVSSEPFTFTFSIAKAPFPWTSTALGALLLITAIALVMAIIERKQIAHKNKEIAAARFDLANEAERERRRIAQDLHDQTLADLRKLMLKSDKLLNNNAEFRAEIETVSDEIRRICEDLSPSVLENVGLTAALEFLLSNTVENYKLLCSDGLEEQLNFSPNVQMQIYRIAQEVLNNIKRHSEANFVEMKITNDVVFQITIENDGKPFLPDFENLSQGRGISNIKSRAKLIEAEIFWQINQEEKTIFTLTK
ncbi:MAG: hypothetical protein MUC29_05220 [Pyrinomonadaceae bacterium]|jgi:signal transduction histidine kinase/ligand-binding sensor domain-containing protein|nr:hypothetical protein [Pyrinomonadaceae bacterium]